MDLETIRIQTFSVMQLDGLLKLCECLKQTGFNDKIQLMLIAEKLSDLEIVLHGFQYALGYQKALKEELELETRKNFLEKAVKSLEEKKKSLENEEHLPETPEPEPPKTSETS